MTNNIPNEIEMTPQHEMALESALILSLISFAINPVRRDEYLADIRDSFPYDDEATIRHNLKTLTEIHAERYRQYEHLININSE